MSDLGSVDCDGKQVELSLFGPSDESDVLNFAKSLDEHDILFLARDIRHPKVIAAWLAQIADGSITSIVARHKGKVCAITALLRDALSWSPHVADLRMVIGADLRGSGLARHLLDRSLELGAEAGAEKFIARMTPDQRSAITLFETAGFTGEALLRDHVRDHAGDPHDLVIMSLHVSEFNRMRAAFGQRE